jgi:hypothetical protein
MNIIRAKVAKVKVGNLEFDGLMDENGSYHIAIPQIADLVGQTRVNAAQTFKRLLGEDFGQTKRLKTDLINAAVSAVSLKDFRRLLSKLADKGNKTARVFLETLADQSLDQAWSDAFEVVRTEDDRQQIYADAFADNWANYDDAKEIEQQELFLADQETSFLPVLTNFKNGKAFHANYFSDPDCYQSSRRVTDVDIDWD